jgi:hypothetical protein
MKRIETVPALGLRKQARELCKTIMLMIGCLAVVGSWCPLSAQRAYIPQALFSINEGGVITGHSFYPYGHGFVRRPSGELTFFDPPGSCGPTLPYSINAQGAITGTFFDCAHGHGFVRDPQGNFTVFDAPGEEGIVPVSINNSGAITGYIINNTGYHGFVRDPQGDITVFDVEGALWTIGYSINSEGSVVGFGLLITTACNRCPHSFLRDPKGNVTLIDPPGSRFSVAIAINNSSNVTGYFSTLESPYLHGFVRDHRGNLTVLDELVGNVDLDAVSVRPTSISENGLITGSYFDGTSSYGFVRDHQGLDLLNNLTGQFFATGINNQGMVTGEYLDSTAHAFVRDATGTVTIFDPRPN